MAGRGTVALPIDHRGPDGSGRRARADHVISSPPDSRTRKPLVGRRAAEELAVVERAATLGADLVLGLDQRVVEGRRDSSPGVGGQRAAHRGDLGTLAGTRRVAVLRRVRRASDPRPWRAEGGVGLLRAPEEGTTGAGPAPAARNRHHRPGCRRPKREIGESQSSELAQQARTQRSPGCD